jgi:hypothetical protein
VTGQAPCFPHFTTITSSEHNVKCNEWCGNTQKNYLKALREWRYGNQRMLYKRVAFLLMLKNG